MKKLITIMSSVTLVVSATSSLTLANQNKKVSEKNILDTDINWNKIENNLSNMFDETLSDSDQTAAMIEKAREESMRYFDNIKKNNLSLEQINRNLAEITTKYENKYQSEIANFRESNNKESKNINQINNSQNFYISRSSGSYEDAKRLLSDFEKKLAITQNTLSTLAVTAGIAAAGFWAASWWFGISIPWAVAATAISASLGVSSAGIGFYRQKNNLNPNILSAVSWALNIRTIATSFKEIVYPVLIISETTVTSSSWAVPATFAAIGLISVIFAWVNDLSSF
ncbi:hypothetical protein [Spiroplasma floricola]|uniref:Transmembrane protein n=1 Tax=Spiroplasma floricola 23-6 TaxID=1336749 RepID=A0A2K8SEE6_9MOLU|nr:hypothetical protein [Spiroplasma floricola]AUB31628.1 hypothetical protein SFLOR_v1c05760 [Spiroplasma floricola 23-6]